MRRWSIISPFRSTFYLQQLLTSSVIIPIPIPIPFTKASFWCWLRWVIDDNSEMSGLYISKLIFIFTSTPIKTSTSTLTSYFYSHLFVCSWFTTSICRRIFLLFYEFALVHHDNSFSVFFCKTNVRFSDI